MGGVKQVQNDCTVFVHMHSKDMGGRGDAEHFVNKFRLFEKKTQDGEIMSV